VKRLAIALAVVLSFSTVEAKDHEQTLAALIVNNQLITDSEVITKDGQILYFTKKRWLELGVVLDDERTIDALISTADLGVGVTFIEESQAYALDIPPKLRPIQKLGHGRPIDTDVGASPRGALLGYDLSVYTKDNGKIGASLAHDLRANVASGTLYHTGQYGENGYIRGMTTWSKDLYKQGLRVQAGDVFSGGRSLASPVNLGGVRIGTDRGLRSEPMYPVPLVGGLADTRSTAELLINGGRGQSQQVEPGPYQFSNLYLSGGLSDISVITKDASGREVLTNRSFYTMPSMVKKGGLEWDVELGLVRQGSASDTYKTPAVVGQMAYGLSDSWTVSAGVQSTGKKTNVSVGTIVSMGKAGAISLDLAKGDKGNAYSVAYERRTRGLTVGASHTKYSDDYWELAHERGSTPFRTKSLTTASVGYGRDNWRGDLSYSNADTAQGKEQRVSARMRYEINSANTVSAYASKNMTTGEVTAALGWQHKFGPSVSGTSTIQFKPTREATASLAGQHTLRNVPVSWQVSSDGDNHYGNVRADFSKATLSADISGHSARVGVEGGLWIGEGGVIPTKKPYGSFVVAEVEDTKGAVVAGTGSVVKTNTRGFAVIANTAPLLKQPLSVDTQSIPMDMQLDNPISDAVAPRGGGAKVTFRKTTDTLRTYRIYVGGKPIEGGQAIGNETVPLGEDGYMVLLAPKVGQIFHVSNKEIACTVTLPALAESAMDITRLDCTEDK
jgi:outer membrane usher protein FimD/PapC